MLVELRIRNFAIIEQAELQFGAGLNVLSGETGAGKTIIMNALALLLGGRAAPEMIRHASEEAVVEALFELEAAEPPDQNGAEPARELLIRRVIAKGGRSRALINDELATLQGLARLGAGLVQIYGQHEQQSLLRAEAHLPILDRYAGLEQELSAYRGAYQQAQELRARLAELERRQRERASLLELASFQAAELERAGLSPGEDEELAAARTVLANAARLAAAAHESEELLYGGDGAAIDSIARAQARLAEAAALDPRLKESLELIASARAALQEVAHTLASYRDRIEADPARLEQIDGRLQELQRIKRKYGGSIASALEALARAHAEIAELEKAAEGRAEAEQRLERALDGLLAMARGLHERRAQGAAELKRRMQVELKSLGMRNAVFELRFGGGSEGESAFVRDGVVLGPSGLDTVEFDFSANLGQPPMALGKIASGGELSRLMLALKRLEAQRRGVATVIFDEVDAGIGGAVAEVVGRKLKQLARFHQVLCITHLPQIAAFADRHFVVEKEERRGATSSRVITLDDRRRADEIARMLAGTEVTERIRRAAKELLERAQA